jgi:hypothetical protein
MGKSGMSAFTRDDSWQKRIREKVLKPFYKRYSFENRFVFTDKGSLADILQKQYAVDTIAQKQDNEIVAIEEKIVRWKGRAYTAFTLETWSCTTAGRERKGWMYTAKCDVLLYCFTQEDESVIAYSIPFPKLQEWFFDNNRFEKYVTTKTAQINQTECRVVPIDDVMKGVAGTKKFALLPDGYLHESKAPLSERIAHETKKVSQWLNGEEEFSWEDK